MPKEIPLTRGKVSLVDDRDYEYLSQFKWCVYLDGHIWYAVRGIGNKTVKMHRIILNAPAGIQVDHIDGDGLNNLRSNLRLATSHENRCNRGKQSNNTSGFKGVFRYSVAGRWRAGIKLNGCYIHIGCFDSAEEAARAYDDRARELHGEFARMNFLSDGES